MLCPNCEVALDTACHSNNPPYSANFLHDEQFLVMDSALVMEGMQVRRTLVESVPAFPLTESSSYLSLKLVRRKMMTRLGFKCLTL